MLDVKPFAPETQGTKRWPYEVIAGPLLCLMRCSMPLVCPCRAGPAVCSSVYDTSTKRLGIVLRRRCEWHSGTFQELLSSLRCDVGVPDIFSSLSSHGRLTVGVHRQEMLHAGTSHRCCGVSRGLLRHHSHQAVAARWHLLIPSNCHAGHKHWRLSSIRSQQRPHSKGCNCSPYGFEARAKRSGRGALTTLGHSAVRHASPRNKHLHRYSLSGLLLAMCTPFTEPLPSLCLYLTHSPDDT